LYPGGVSSRPQISAPSNDFHQTAFCFGSVLKHQLYQAAYVLPVLAERFQRLVQSRGGNFQGEIAVGKEADFFQLLV